jgi:hypothetical protein
MKRSKLTLIGAIGVAVAATGLVASGVLGGAFSGAASVGPVVPNVLGMTASAAESAITAEAAQYATASNPAVTPQVTIVQVDNPSAPATCDGLILTASANFGSPLTDSSSITLYVTNDGAAGVGGYSGTATNSIISTQTVSL